MIEGCILPARSIMAGGTDCAELTVVRIPGGMTGNTLCWCAFEDSIDMAGFALKIAVAAG